MPRKFIVIDGNSLIHRAFYALPLLKTAQGQFTNAAYGFTTMLLKLLEEERPDYLAVAFDKGKVTFRTHEFAGYKAQRQATPVELREQFPLVHAILDAFGIPRFEAEGYEADDLIGAITCRVAEQGDEMLIVTGDRDTLQLIGPRAKVLLTRKGITELERYDEAVLKEKLGLTPGQITDLKGLMGDASDNIPGVPGVGEKTALKLIHAFGSIENILNHIDAVPGKKLQETLREYAEQALLSKRLATIVCNLPVEIDLAACRLREPDWAKVRELFHRLEFKSLLKRLDKEPAVTVEEPFVLPPARSVTAAQAAALAQDIRRAGAVGLYPVYTRDNWGETILAGLGVAVPGEQITGYFCSRDAVDAWNVFISLMAEPAIAKYTYDAKPLYRSLWREGHHLAGLDFDAMVAAYLLDPTRPDYPLTDLARRCLGLAIPDALSQSGKNKGDRGEYPQEDLAAWAATAITSLRRVLKKELENNELAELYLAVELPLVEVLADMERNGIALDTTRLEEMSAETGKKIDALVKEIYSLAGTEFNINSTRQLGQILFDVLKLPVQKKTKTGVSTDAEVLEKLAGSHPIVDKLLEYRLLVKLKTTYLDTLGKLVNKRTGRVHTTFHQTVTATGRLSSSDPNLQNIPIRSEIGRRIREVFIPGERDSLLISADYSQIELRVLAHLSQDPVFVEAFRHNEDIHARTAAEVFGVPMEAVTPEMRSRAKAVNFGIVYGISDFGLARNIGVTRQEAQAFIAGYFRKYSKVREYMDHVVRMAREAGYVTTLLNRRRYLPDIVSSNYNLRSFAERTAMNTPIQGTAADIIKKAMVKVQEELRRHKFKAKLLLQVHDELVLEAPAEEAQAVARLVKELMEGSVALTVPLTVDVKIGPNWGAAEKIIL